MILLDLILAVSIFSIGAFVLMLVAAAGINFFKWLFGGRK